MHLIGTGDTPEAFLQLSDVSERDPDADRWRSFTIAIDLCGDGWSACQYMTHL